MDVLLDTLYHPQDSERIVISNSKMRTARHQECCLLVLFIYMSFFPMRYLRVQGPGNQRGTNHLLVLRETQYEDSNCARPQMESIMLTLTEAWRLTWQAWAKSTNWKFSCSEQKEDTEPYDAEDPALTL